MKKGDQQILCPTCGQEITVNPAALMGRIKSRKRLAASRRNGRFGGRPRNKPKVEPVINA